jgi:hypothetical protein
VKDLVPVWRLLLLMVFVVAASVGAADQKVAMHVSPIVGFAPSDVLIDTTIEHREGVRRLEVMIDSDGYFRASTIELDGERAARVISVRFRQVPAGEYEVRVELLSSDGQPIGFAAQWITLS